MSSRPPVPGSFDRAVSLQRLGEVTFDVVVVGGGVTGAGVALDAASRGLTTALVEKGDFASGTSSKSSKLVHGGLRYLQQHDFRLVYEALHERQRLLTNAPHLVEIQPFLIPLFAKAGVADAAVTRLYSTALWLYDLTGGVRIGKRHRKIGRDEAAAHMPTLRTDHLAAGFIYYDARVDDARLTVTLARTAALDHGAVVANYLGATGFERDAGGRTVGVVVEGPGLDSPLTIRTRSVVNATGVWADEVRALDEGSAPGTIRPAKGIHVAVDRERLPCDIASVLPVRGDRRSIFVIPWAWGGQTYIGTTDTDFEGSLDEPSCTSEDVAYLLDAVNAYLSEPLTPEDVTGTWAGLRPLVASGPLARSARTADLSRRHHIWTSKSGIVTVTGGKLTTYRLMASDTVDTVIATAKMEKVRCRTRKMALRGARGFEDVADEHLARRFGGEATAVADLCRSDPGLARPLVPGTPYQAAEAVHACRAEMAVTLEDVLARRTRALLVEHRATVDAAEDVAVLVGAELGWDDAERERQVALFCDSAARSVAGAGLPLDEVA